MSLQRRVRVGRGASLRGAWVCSISWARACALRKLTRRTCLNGAPFGARSELYDGPRNRANPGESVRSTDRLVDAPRPTRTRLCRVPLTLSCRITPTATPESQLREGSLERLLAQS